MNNHMLNVLQAEHRILDFHVHEHSDEMFYCIEGAFAAILPFFGIFLLAMGLVIALMYIWLA